MVLAIVLARPANAPWPLSYIPSPYSKRNLADIAFNVLYLLDECDALQATSFVDVDGMGRGKTSESDSDVRIEATAESESSWERGP